MTTHLPIKQVPGLVSQAGDKWDVRDRSLGRSAPFGPSGVTREQAEAWLADPVRVVVTATLRDHGEDHGNVHPRNEAGQKRCRCGAPWPNSVHFADMIAERLAAAGVLDTVFA